MAKKPRRFSRGASLRLLPLLGTVKALIYPFGSNIDRAKAGDWEGITDAVVAGITGYSITDSNFEYTRLNEGLVPIVMTSIASKVLDKLGVNRRLGAFTKKFLGFSIKL